MSLFSHARFVKPAVVIAALLALAACAVYIQTLSFSFIGFDDPDLIITNIHVRAGLTADSLAWAFGAAWRENVFFYPLAIVSHMADVSLFGLDAGGHHLSSMVLHAGTVLGLFFLLFSLTGAAWRSGFVAGVFAVHPLTADSVAWVAERSNVLCALFWMATMLAYVGYCRAGRRKPAWYLFCLVLFVLALLAKPVAVTLPVVLLAADWLVLDRFKKNPATGRQPDFWPVLGEKIPFLVLAGLRAGANIIVPVATGTAVSAAHTPTGLRFANGLAVIPVYIRRMFAPYDLSIYYPFPDTVALWKPAAVLLLLAVVTALLFYLRRKKSLVLFGWLWFLTVLVPTLGLIQSGPWPAMADHFVYLPMIGLILAATWIVPEEWTSPGAGPARYVSIIAIAVVVVTGVAGFFHTRHYRNSITIFEQAVKVTGRNFFALTGLGNAYAEQGRPDKAEVFFKKALLLQPGSPGAHANLGLVAAAQGAEQKAKTHFTAALAVDPFFAPAHVGMGNLLLAAGRPEAAIVHYQQALATDPDLVSAHNNLALALAASGATDKALHHLRKTIPRFPHRPELRRTLARLLARTGARR